LSDDPDSSPGWDRRQFDGQTEGEINRSINPVQRRSLREFFGQGIHGALDRQQHFKLPTDLTRDVLVKYGEIALRVIESGRDLHGVQTLRLELIRQALRAMQQ
jgi:hypothetical protein